jgi:hypothetical protein
MKYLILMLACLSIVGCAAIRHKQRTQFCVGVCVQHDGETDKGGSEPPKKPEPTEKQP